VGSAPTWILLYHYQSQGGHKGPASVVGQFEAVALLDLNQTHPLPAAAAKDPTNRWWAHCMVCRKGRIPFKGVGQVIRAAIGRRVSVLSNVLTRVGKQLANIAAV
jgi:hypothetical protein